MSFPPVRLCLIATLLTTAPGLPAVDPPALSPPPAKPPASRPAEPAMPVDGRQEADLLKLAGPDFHIMRTPHFVVAFNTSRPLVSELVGRLEDTYRAVYRFAGMIDIEAARSPRRLEAIFFNRREEYDRFAARLGFPGAGTYGVYSEPTNRSAFFNVYNDPEMLDLQADITESRDRLEELAKVVRSAQADRPLVFSYGRGKRETLTRAQAQKRLRAMERDLKTLDAKRVNYSERINRMVIQHEAAHQVLFNAGVHVRGASNPKWIVEGLACLFETPPSESGGGIAAINQLRLKSFREVLAGESEKRNPTVQDFTSAIASGRMESPKRLVGDSRVFDNRQERGEMIYAMTWSLANYLQHRQTKALAAYLREIAERRPDEAVDSDGELDLFEKHFGKLDDAFVRQWGQYTLQLNSRAIGGL